MKVASLKHQFVTSAPERLEDGVLYVSLAYRTAMHKCCCGCGHEVVTPFSPTDWQMLFDGISISLHPSIGNWSLACRSHYWIDRNKIVWAGQWSNAQVEAGRRWDRELKGRYYGEPSGPRPSAEPQPAPKVPFWKEWVSGWW